MNHGDSLEDDFVPDNDFVAVEDDDDDGVAIEDDDAGEDFNSGDTVEDSQASGSGPRPGGPVDDGANAAKKRKRREKEKEKKAKVHHTFFVPRTVRIYSVRNVDCKTSRGRLRPNRLRPKPQRPSLNTFTIYIQRHFQSFPRWN